MNIAEVIILVIMLTGTLLTFRDHGKPSKDNGWLTLASTAIMLSLMYWAGLFH